MSKMDEKTKEVKKLSMIPCFMKVFCEQGLDGAFMRKLASASGVSLALLYQYFENKDDIIRQSTAHYHERIQQELTAVIIGSIDRPEEMPGVILDYVDSVIDICRFLLQVMAHPTYCAMMEETGQRVTAHIMKVAEVLREKRGLSEETAVGVAFLLNSIVNDYILKKSRENFLAQFGAIHHQVTCISRLSDSFQSI